MSFGFSVGDILAGAHLAGQLYRLLSSASKINADYHDLIASLHVIHRVFLQIEQIRAIHPFTQATLNALLFAVNSANDRMVTFLAKYQKYETAFRPGGSGSSVTDAQRRVTWGMVMPGEVEKLRKSLNTTLISISCLLQLLQTHDCPRVEIANSEADRHFKSTFDGQSCKITERIGRNKYSEKCLDPNFELQPKSQRYFKPGEVFSIFVGSQIRTGEIGPSFEGSDPPYTREASSYVGPILIRRFVVVREGYDSCLCLGVHTYGGRGCVDRPDQNHHAILYCGTIPTPKLPGEEAMTLNPIKMVVGHPSTVLSPASRINLGTVYEVLHECQVRPLGVVDVMSITYLLASFDTLNSPSSVGNDQEDITNTKSASTDNVEILHEKEDVAKSLLNKENTLSQETYYTESPKITLLDSVQSDVASITNFDELEMVN